MNLNLFNVRMDVDQAELAKVCSSGYIGQGPKVEEFEKQLSNFIGNPNFLTVNSCTSAIHLALHLCKDLPGEEILVTPLTCTATIWPILHNHLPLRWVDIDPDTGNMDMADLRRKVSRKTKAILAVHWGGYPLDYDALLDIRNTAAEKYGHRPQIIEDAAHALGANFDGRPIGSNNGNFICFSFQAIKHLTTGDGGALVLPESMYKRAKLLRWFGLDRESSTDMRCCQNVTEAGYKFHMNDIAATIGIGNMNGLPEAIAKHRHNGESYSRELADIRGVRLMESKYGFDSACWVYTIAVADRPRFVANMKESGIAVSQVHARCDNHSCVAQFREPLPNMDRFESEYIAIPSGWWIGEEERHYIVDTIRKVSK